MPDGVICHTGTLISCSVSLVGKELLIHEQLRNWPRATKHKAFSWTHGGNGLQLSLQARALASKSADSVRPSQKSALFQIAGKLRWIGAENDFKQVEIAHMAANRYFAKLIQPSYTLSTQNQAAGIILGLLGNAGQFDCQADNVNHVQLSSTNGDVEITSAFKVLMKYCIQQSPQHQSVSSDLAYKNLQLSQQLWVYEC